MVWNFGIVINAILFALGVFWCYQILGRWREDLEELRTGRDNLGKAVIVGLWALTAVVAFWVVNSAVGLVGNIVSGIRGLI